MPGFDGTGPRGMGSMTGGGRGFCTSPRRNHWLTSLRGRNRTLYTGSWNTPFSPQITREEELDSLKNEATYIKEELDHIETRIRELTDQKE